MARILISPNKYIQGKGELINIHKPVVLDKLEQALVER